jgi:hypothetical protein
LVKDSAAVKSISYLRPLLILSAIALYAGAANAKDATAFSKDVTALTQDWIAEDWKDNTIRLHPARYNEYADVQLTLLPEEKANGRSAMQLLKYYFEGTTVSGNNGDKKVDIAGAEEMAPGMPVAVAKWVDGFDELTGMWGVVTTASGNLIAYNGACDFAHEEYGEYGDVCLKKITLILTALQQGALKMPPPEGILPIPWWEDSYQKDGMSVARKKIFNGIRSYSPSTIKVSPPVSISADQLPTVLDGFAAAMVEDDEEGRVDSSNFSAKIVGTANDPWVRRDYPVKNSDEGYVSTYMAGTEKLPDGQTVLIGMRCINDTWRSSCNYGVESARRLVKEGFVESKRVAIVEAGKVPLPANGIRNDQIQGIYQGYQFTGIFLKDGTVYTDFNEAPAMIVASKSKSENPDYWGSWRQVGNNLIVTDSDGEKRTIGMDADARLIGGTAATRLNGYYGTISSTSNGMMGGSVSRSGYTFYPDGTIETSSSSMFSVSAYLPGSGDFTPQQIAAGGGSSNNRAKYEINGYMLTITYPDGRQSRLSFAIPARSQNMERPESVIIGGGTFNIDGGE